LSQIFQNFNTTLVKLASIQKYLSEKNIKFQSKKAIDFEMLKEKIFQQQFLTNRIKKKLKILVNF
jgi:hypothetical protein